MSETLSDQAASWSGGRAEARAGACTKFTQGKGAGGWEGKSAHVQGHLGVDASKAQVQHLQAASPESLRRGMEVQLRTRPPVNSHLLYDLSSKVDSAQGCGTPQTSEEAHCRDQYP